MSRIKGTKLPNYNAGELGPNERHDKIPFIQVGELSKNKG